MNNIKITVLFDGKLTTYIRSTPLSVISDAPETSKKFKLEQCSKAVSSNSLLAMYGTLSRFRLFDVLSSLLKSERCVVFPEGSS